MALSASLLAAAVTAPAPSVASGADPHVLTHRKTQLNHRLTSSHADLDEISRQLLNAQGRLDSAAADLAGARGTLDGLQVQVQQATLRDQRMQQALGDAIQRLDNAKADFTQGRKTVAQQRGALAAFAISSSSTRLSQLSTLNLVITADSTQAAISQVQGANSALDKQVTDLQRLQANQVLLRFTEQRIQGAADQVRVDRRLAAANLVTTQRLEAQAAAAEATVEDRVSALQVQKDKLATAKTAEMSRIKTMQRERSHLETRLRRIAAQRAAAARRAAERRAAERRAAVSPSRSSSTASSDGGFLSWPVTDTYITSPYGMRLHPILHIWELHDGTDFHAVCGTPVHAAADGRVLAEYYNAGYGNRIIVDHGFVKGVSLATSYNHLTSFVAHTGQQVKRGQLIAYSGTTGYSTGCHLHFMVYVNGATVDPMTWL